MRCESINEDSAQALNRHFDKNQSFKKEVLPK
uniref:Uncharacterized protein n=1 Tax=Ciona intestinalis TaxID=7719 RepID=H2XQ45_CIOIN